jgi:PAS domain S-box-containing protein
MSSQALPAKAEPLFRYLFEQASLGIAVEDLDGKILMANPALCSMLGYSEDELAGMTCSQFANPEDSKDDWALFQKLREGAIDHYTLEKRYATKQGVPFWGRLNVSLLKTVDEESPLVFAFVEDITEHNRAEDALRESEERLRLAIQAGRMYAFDWVVATDVILRSKESMDILNWPDPEHDTGRAFHERIHPDDLAMYTAMESRLTPENSTYQMVFRTLNPGGDVIWLEDTGRAFFDAQGKMVRVTGMVADITDRKQAEQELRHSEERFRLAAQAGKMYAYEWDPASDVVTRSEEYVNILGLRDPAEKLTRDQLAARVHPEDRSRFVSSVDQLTPENPITQMSYRVFRPDGSVIWLEKNGRAHFDEQRRLLCVTGMVADITERKQAEERLREYEKAVEGSEEMIVVVDREYRYLIANRKFLKLRNLTKEQVIGRLIPEVLNKEVFEKIVKEKLDECFAGKVVKFEMRYTYPELGERDLFVSYFPIEGAAGIDRAVCVLQDITERKQVQEALKKSEEKFSKAFQHGPMALTLTNAKGHRFIDVNETFERITGWRRDEVIGRTSFDIELWADPAESVELANRLPSERSLQNLEFRFRMRDGSIRIGLASAELIELDGEPCILGVTADITDYKRSQEALRESEARERARAKELEAILDAVPVPVLIAHDAECRHITGNRAASEQLREERGQNLSQSAPPGERPAFRQIKNGVEIPADLLPMQQAAATGKPMYGRVLTLLFEDGTLREEIANAVPLLDDSGKPRGAVGASMDVTELKRTEGALRESEDKLRLLLDSTAEAIYGVDLEHRCTFCNPATLRALGYEHTNQVLGKNMHTLIHHTRADGTPFPVGECRVHRVARSGEGVHAEGEVFWRSNGTSFPVEYWSYPQSRGQEVVGAVVTFIDITERKLAEAALANVSRKLIEAQEQERTRIGRELHDDIGQRLALVAVELQQLHKDVLVFPRVRSRLGELQKKVSEIAADTQSLSHELHSARLQYLGITAAMRGFCREFSEQQKVKVDFKANDLPTALSADISLCLFRVLQEALHNSAKHSGVLRFEVRLWGTTNEVHLTVKDSGKGFDREAEETSQGLGLISMEERLKLVNGTLSIESQPGRGTTIEARVPVGSASDSMRAAG